MPITEKDSHHGEYRRSHDELKNKSFSEVARTYLNLRRFMPSDNIGLPNVLRIASKIGGEFGRSRLANRLIRQYFSRHNDLS